MAIFLNLSWALGVASSFCFLLVQLWLDWQLNTGKFLEHTVGLGLMLTATLICCKTIFEGKPRSLFTVRKVKKSYGSTVLIVLVFMLFSTLGSFISLTQNSAQLLAAFLDEIGQYEAGECVYANFVHINDNSLASLTHGLSGKLSFDQERANICVAKLYGENSKQMARRYLTLGFYFQNKVRDYKKAEECFSKACKLYAAIHDPNHRLCSLSCVAYIQFESKNVHLGETLKFASRQIPQDSSLSNSSKRALAVLWSISKQIDQTELALTFLKGLGSTSLTEVALLPP